MCRWALRRRGRTTIRRRAHHRARRCRCRKRRTHVSPVSRDTTLGTDGVENGSGSMSQCQAPSSPTLPRSLTAVDVEGTARCNEERHEDGAPHSPSVHLDIVHWGNGGGQRRCGRGGGGDCRGRADRGRSWCCVASPRGACDPASTTSDGGADPAAVLPLLPVAVAAASDSALPPVDAFSSYRTAAAARVIIEGIVMDALDHGVYWDWGLGQPQ